MGTYISFGSNSHFFQTHSTLTYFRLASPSLTLAMQRLENIEKYGFTAVPRDPEVLLAGIETTGQQADYKLSEVPFPDSELV